MVVLRIGFRLHFTITETYLFVRCPDWKNWHLLSERLDAFDIMWEKWRAPLNTIVLWSTGVSGLSPQCQKKSSLSDSYTSDRCCFSRLAVSPVDGRYLHCFDAALSASASIFIHGYFLLVLLWKILQRYSYFVTSKQWWLFSCHFVY